jgi:uracil permease
LPTHGVAWATIVGITLNLVLKGQPEPVKASAPVKHGKVKGK